MTALKVQTEIKPKYPLTGIENRKLMDYLGWSLECFGYDGNMLRCVDNTGELIHRGYPTDMDYIFWSGKAIDIVCHRWFWFNSATRRYDWKGVIDCKNDEIKKILRKLFKSWQDWYKYKDMQRKDNEN